MSYLSAVQKLYTLALHFHSTRVVTINNVFNPGNEE